MTDTANGIRVLDDKILCELEAAERKAGQIIAPKHSKSQQNSSTCRVLAVGPGRMFETGQRNEMTVSPGDRILIGAQPTAIRINNRTYFIVELFDVVAVLDRDATLDAFQP